MPDRSFSLPPSPRRATDAHHPRAAPALPTPYSCSPSPLACLPPLLHASTHAHTPTWHARASFLLFLIDSTCPPSSPLPSDPSHRDKHLCTRSPPATTHPPDSGPPRLDRWSTPPSPPSPLSPTTPSSEASDRRHRIFLLPTLQRHLLQQHPTTPAFSDFASIRQRSGGRTAAACVAVFLFREHTQTRRCALSFCLRHVSTALPPSILFRSEWFLLFTSSRCPSSFFCGFCLLCETASCACRRATTPNLPGLLFSQDTRTTPSFTQVVQREVFVLFQSCVTDQLRFFHFVFLVVTLSSTSPFPPLLVFLCLFACVCALSSRCSWRCSRVSVPNVATHPPTLPAFLCFITLFLLLQISPSASLALCFLVA